MSSSGKGVQCYASCPASTVCIRPPPFVLTIPGPALYCPDQPFKIEQCNPCAGFGGGRALVGSGAFISLDAGNIMGDEAEDSLGSDDSMELFLRRPWGRPGWGRPGWGRPGWGRPGWGRPGWGRPGWGRPGWGYPGRGSYPGWGGRPGWGRPGWGTTSVSSGRSGVDTELFNEDTYN